jgi:hypothetical protein
MPAALRASGDPRRSQRWAGMMALRRRYCVSFAAQAVSFFPCAQNSRAWPPYDDGRIECF